MRNILFPLLLIFMSCASQQSTDHIILTCGFSEDPDERRLGIDITIDSIFFCREKIQEEGEYECFGQNFEPEKFYRLAGQIKKYYSYVDQDQHVLDGVKYEMIVQMDSKVDTFRFYRCNLTKDQNVVLNSILELQNIKFDKIEYHYFPDNLLREKLSIPPPVVRSEQ